MRLNLLVLFALLGVIAVRSVYTAQSTSLRWKQTCADGVSFPMGPGGFYCKWLEIENDRYRFCDQCSTSTEVFERGFTELEGVRLTLVSDQGKRKQYRLSEGAGEWFLSDAEGKVYEQERESQPRLHPSPEWFDHSKPLELDAPHSRPEDKIWNHEPAMHTSDNSFPQFTISKLDSDLEGSRLIQGGRGLLEQLPKVLSL